MEQIVDAPVPQAVEELAEVFMVFSQDRIQQRAVEQTIDTLATSLAEKMIVEVPVVRMPDKTQHVANAHVQHVVNTVKVERLQIILQTWQKPIIQEKINQETKQIEVSPLQFTNKVVDISVVAQRQTRSFQKTAEISQVQVVPETVEIPKLPFDEKIVVNPGIQTVQGPQTSESLNGEFDAGHDGKSEQDALARQPHRSKHNNQQQSTRQAMQEKPGEREGEERERGRKGERGKEEERRTAEEEGDTQVKKDVTGWTVVTRNKRQKKTVQIFVKLDEMKTVLREVSPEDKVQEILNTVGGSEQDVYVTCEGKMLRKDEQLKSCGVRDGSTIQVTSRVRGGGKHKDKKSKAEKQAASAKTPEQKFTDEEEGDRGPVTQECDRDAAIRMIEENEEQRKVMVRMLEENEDNWKMIESMSEGSDEDMERTLQNYRTAGYEVLGWSQEQVEMMERGLRWAVEARRKGRRQQEEEQRRRGEQGQHLGQEQSKQGKQVRCGDEEQFEEAEVRTGRGSAGLVRGGDERCRTDETNRKGKGKGDGGKGEHEGKGGGFGHKGKHPEMRERKEERVRMAPNMGAGGSHPQATSDPGKEEREKKETRLLSWADCNDEEASGRREGDGAKGDDG